MKKILLLLSFIPVFVYSQFPKDIINQNCYDSGWPDNTEDFLVTEDAMYFLADQTTDDGNQNYDHNIVLVKTDLEGKQYWIKTYGGSLPDFSRALIRDNEGYIYIGAGTYSIDGDSQSGIMGGEDAWVIKIDTSGAIIWEKTFGGSKDDYSAELLYLENGNILLYTATFSSDYDVEMNYGFLDLWFSELNTNGDIINSKSYGSSNHDNLFSLIQTSDGGFFTAARAGANDGSVNGEPKGGNDVWLLKLDASLNIEWQKLIGGSLSDGGGYGLTELPDGGYIFNGKTRSSDKDVHGFDFPEVPDQDDNWVVRLDSGGNIIWDIALGGDRFESSSKVFANNDGTFTVFGSTSSSNNGDVEGKHYTLLYPNNINYDIWMVHLNENGELIDQRCFGNASATSIYRGVTKIADYHYLIAGSAFARPADPDNPEAPTDGEVYSGYTSTSKDIWFFEIVDCEYFQPATPLSIEGDSIICTDQSIQTTYMTQIVNPNYEEAQWLLEPEEAGEISNLQDSAIINWNINYEGQVELMVRSISDCGESEFTEPFVITLNAQAETPANVVGQDTICTVNTTSTTYYTQIYNPQYEEAQWQMLPIEAGELTNLQDSAIIQWNSSFEGQVELSVRSTSNCGESDYTEPKIIEVRGCVGIGEIHQKELKIYPNPANTQITFELPEISKASFLQIKDIFGKTLKEYIIIKGQTQLQWDCSQIPGGVYFYQTEIYGVVYRGKIIVK
jgi:hypothetical protein